MSAVETDVLVEIYRTNRRKIEENAKLLNVPITVFESDVFAAADAADEENPCYLCARMRRGHLYAKAKELGCNKIALGHQPPHKTIQSPHF